MVTELSGRCSPNPESSLLQADRPSENYSRDKFQQPVCRPVVVLGLRTCDCPGHVGRAAVAPWCGGTSWAAWHPTSLFPRGVGSDEAINVCRVRRSGLDLRFPPLRCGTCHSAQNHHSHVCLTGGTTMVYEQITSIHIWRLCEIMHVIVDCCSVPGQNPKREIHPCLKPPQGCLSTTTQLLSLFTPSSQQFTFLH